MGAMVPIVFVCYGLLSLERGALVIPVHGLDFSHAFLVTVTKTLGM
jgi:hypothetical protein